ncbi:MAG: hypothetical protein IKJ68_00265 [Clostridia bacterium]|nr:hypothetical protein [Clostridia bacterium]
MRKISLILVFALLASMMVNPLVYAEISETKSYDAEIIANTKGLMDSLSISYTNTDDYDTEVSRRDFTYILMQFMNAKGSALATAHGFSDVDESVLNFMLGYATNTGIISKSEFFYPDRSITYAEAIKMAVVALGYANEAGMAGGYPQGYIIVAANLDLTDGISFEQSSPLSYGDMLMLINNFINIDIRMQTGYGDNFEYSITKGHTILSEHFKLKKISGIIEADEVSSLYDKNLKSSTGHITLAGTDYIYDGGYTLGTRVTAYATTDERHERIVFMQPEETNIINVYPAQNPNMSGNTFNYDDEEVRVSSHVAVLYNGQAYMSYSNDDFKIKSGNLLLIDNDDNKTIDVIHINESEIFIVSEVNISDNLIFIDGGGQVIDLTVSDKPCIITLDGKAASLKDIPSGAVISCYYNKDDEPALISASTKSISGVLSEIASTEQVLYIDGNKYYYNEYFKTNYLSDVTAGANTSFLLDSNGYITSTSLTVTDMQYGYMVGLTNPQGMSEGPMMKIFTQGGSVNIYNLAKKVKVDSQSSISAEEVIKLDCFYNSDNSVKEQLIKYDLNDNDEISVIDTELSENDHNTGTATTGFYDDTADAYDSLKRYAYPGSDTTSTLAYKTTGVMVPYFYLTLYTPVLVINADKSLSDEDRFSVTTRAMFIKDFRYTCKNMLPYNVSEAGEVEIMVYIDEAGSGSSALDTESAYGVVESFNQAIIPATGEAGYRLSIFDGGVFKDLYVKNLTSLESEYTGNDKANGELPLSPGDFIRYTADARNIIRSVDKDFDASNGIVLNYATTGDNSTMRYDYGKVYAKSNAAMLMVSTSANAADITNGTADLKCINVSNIGIIYDSATGTVSPGSYSDIIPYVYSPDLCSTVLIRNRYALGYMFVIYK